MGISKFDRVATSYWPAWLENSWLALSRRSFSGSTVKLTLMPVCLVKLSAVSFCRSTIWGLLTMSTLTVSLPPPPRPPPPHPAHPLSPTALAAATATTVGTARFLGTIALLLMRGPDVGAVRLGPAALAQMSEYLARMRVLVWDTLVNRWDHTLGCTP